MVIFNTVKKKKNILPASKKFQEQHFSVWK